MTIFIEYPLLALLPGVFFWGIGRRNRSRDQRWTVRAAAAWWVYALYEWGVSLRLLCSGDCGIRADLILVYPILLALSSAALVATLIRTDM